MPANIDHIVSFFESQKEIAEYLTAQNEISRANEIEGSLAKTLVVATASYFEDFLTQTIIAHVEKNSTDLTVVEFCKVAAIEQKYHSWFDWKATTATKFFRLFGDATKQKAADRIKVDPDLNVGIGAFMFLGSQRNLIVHRNMLAYALSDTSEEVIKKARLSLRFVDYVADELFK